MEPFIASNEYVEIVAVKATSSASTTTAKLQESANVFTVLQTI